MALEEGSDGVFVVDGAEFVGGAGVDVGKIVEAGDYAGDSAVAVVHFWGMGGWVVSDERAVYFFYFKILFGGWRWVFGKKYLFVYSSGVSVTNES